MERDSPGPAPMPRGFGSKAAPRAPSKRAGSTPRRRAPVVLTDASELSFGKIVGSGSQGCVRLAKHRASGRRFVVKLLPLGAVRALGSPRTRSTPRGAPLSLSVTDEEARRVEAEAELLRLASDHPNVVRFHGAFRRPPGPTHGPQLCIVMSHCEGGDLATLLKRHGGRPLPEDAIVRWLAQLLLGLHHVHSKSILHRDVKPANVFLSKSLAVARIGDFGIAKALARHDDLACTVVGTPLYMSPELCQGKPYTYAADVWALGCVAYEMASGGAKAFDAPGWPQLLAKIVRNEYEPIPSHFSRPFAALLAMMLAPDPEERPSTERLLNVPLVRKRCEAMAAEENAAAPGSAAARSPYSPTTRTPGVSGGGIGGPRHHGGSSKVGLVLTSPDQKSRAAAAPRRSGRRSGGGRLGGGLPRTPRGPRRGWRRRNAATPPRRGTQRGRPWRGGTAWR